MLDHLCFKFHFLLSLLFDGILEDKFLFFEVIDLGFKGVDVHGGALVGSARVEDFFLQSVVLVL